VPTLLLGLGAAFTWRRRRPPGATTEEPTPPAAEESLRIAP
jgi:hypothetical protein